MSDWIDVTRPMGERMQCWPGRLPPGVEWERRISDGGYCNASAWALSAHTGTHIDAPLHFVEGGASIDELPPDLLVGPCRVVEHDSDLSDVRGEGRLLVRCGFSHESRRYPPHGPLMEAETAQLLLDAGLLVLGTDRLSVDRTEPGEYYLHRMLLEAGCVIIEGIDLSRVRPGRYRMIALPLRFEGAEGSPARVLLSREPLSP